MIRPTAILILYLLSTSYLARAQMPNLQDGREIWRGRHLNQELRLVQIPKRAAALLPMRFLLEELQGGGPGGPVCAHCASPGSTTQAGATNSEPGVLESLSHAEIRALPGSEAAHAYTPTRHTLHQWGNHVIEVRETFRAAGTYQLAFAWTDSAQPINVEIEVRHYPYIQFGKEFSFFVAGCLVLGLMLWGIVRWLHARLSLPNTNPGSPA